MGRLIDADDVKKMISDTFEKEKDVINSFWKMGTLMDKVDEIQTAYDVDAVVEQLEDYGNEETHYYKNTPYEKCIEECIGKAIQIVEGGGVDGN